MDIRRGHGQRSKDMDFRGHSLVASLGFNGSSRLAAATTGLLEAHRIFKVYEALSGPYRATWSHSVLKLIGILAGCCLLAAQGRTLPYTSSCFYCLLLPDFEGSAFLRSLTACSYCVRINPEYLLL